MIKPSLNLDKKLPLPTQEIKFHLSNYENRENVSKAYYDAFKDNYDVHKLAKKLVENIKGV